MRATVATTFRDLGDGPPCPEPEAEHGKLYTLGSGRLWCPVSQTIFDKPVITDHGWIAGAILRAGEVAVISKPAHVVLSGEDDLVGRMTHEADLDALRAEEETTWHTA